MKFSEIKYQDPATKTYLGSPSIIRTDDGDLLVTHDYFGTGCPKNHENEEHLTSVYRSSDEGMTWFNVTHISNAFWSNLFKHKGTIYLLGTSQQNGSIVIKESIRQTGFQYVDWQFDGDDIIYVVRVAYDGAHNFHDANRITFHRIENIPLRCI